MGYLEVITGSMFSGKTEELIRRIKRATIARKRVLLFKPSIDNRYNEHAVTSHDGRDLQAIVVPVDQPEIILDHAQREKAEVVGIDEAQFFAVA